VKNTQLSGRFYKMSKDNTERGKKRVTRTGGVPQVEYEGVPQFRVMGRPAQPVQLSQINKIMVRYPMKRYSMQRLFGFILLILLIFVVKIIFRFNHESAMRMPLRSPSKQDVAQAIVEQTYKDTFAHIVENCPNSMKHKECCLRFYNLDTEATPNNNSTMNHTAQHWWFRSMIRDAYNLEKSERPSRLDDNTFHVAQTSNPNVSMCKIEKIGSSTWSKVFRQLNNNKVGNKLQSGKGPIMDLPGSKEESPSVVIFRDPLERFLSAYIDKCVTSFRRTGEIENHCEPSIIFNEKEKKSTKSSREFVKGFVFEKDHKAMFSAYVDIMPLKWNMHFFPQSLYCNGVYRFLDGYDFIGYMNTTFDQTLDALISRYGGRFGDKIDEIFDLSSKREATSKGIGPSIVGTKNLDRALKYYTPRSLRRVLEYVSIDYVLLKMEIPEWAKTMLRE